MRGLTWEQEWAALVAVALALLFVRAVVAAARDIERLEMERAEWRRAMRALARAVEASRSKQ